METKINCLPVYLVIDTSQSMAPFEDVLNETIETLYDELVTSPRISDFAFVSILSYNTDAEVVLQMTELHTMDALPQLACGGISNFVKALRLLRQRIEEDISHLNGVGREVLRPVVFLLTGGQPSDEQGDLSDNWKSDYAALVHKSYRRHPNVIPFGYGAATSEILNEVSTIPGAAFLAKEGRTSEALRKVIPALLNTLVASVRDNVLRLPAEVDGFIRVSPEIIDAAHDSDAPRRAVLDAVPTLDYRPNRLAPTRSSGTVGVLLNDLRNPWFVELLEGLSTALHTASLAPILADNYTDVWVGRRSVETLLTLGVDGLVVVGATAEAAAIAAAAESIPVVLAGTRQPRLPYADVAVNDDEFGARLATEHLISLGHRRIAHLRGPGIVGNLRHAGYQSAMTEAGLNPGTYAEAAGMSEESSYAAARRLLARPHRPTAVFAFNDTAAVGALSAAADQGISVPADLSLVGYDNTYLARIRHISLTSVANGNFAVGVQAGKFLTERLKMPNLVPSRTYSVPTQLHVRGSSGPNTGGS